MILSGILLTPTGVPYKNSSVRITANNTSEQVLKFVHKEFKTGDDGSYEIDVPNGWYHVSVFSLEYRSYVNIGNIEVTDETTETTLNELLMLDQTAHSDGLAAQVAANAASALASKNAAAVSATQAATSATNASSSATTSANSATVSQISASSSASSASASQASADLAASLLSTKENVIASGTIGQYWRGDKTFQTLDKSVVGLSNVDNTSDIGKPVSTAQQATLNLKTDKSVSLLSWAYSSSFQLVSATRDSNEAIITASIVWPDGVTGIFTTDVASTAFPGAIDAWHATYVNSPTKTITQTVVTRDAAGAVIAQPAITVT